VRRWWILIAATALLHTLLFFARPLHLDSLFTGGKMRMSWPELWADLQTNAYTPLYYVALKIYTLLAGTSPFALHLPSILAAVASLPALAWAMRPVEPDPRARFWAAALAGLHPFLVLYGSDFAKCYALLWLAMILGAGCYLGGRWRPYALCAVVASQLHAPGLALPVVVALHSRKRPALLVLGLAAALFALWSLRLGTRLSPGGGLDWIPHLDAAALGLRAGADWVHLLCGTWFPWPVSLVLALVCVALPLLLARRIGGSRFLRLSIALPFACLFALALMRPLWHIRYLGFVLFPACAMLGSGLVRLRWHAVLLLLFVARLHGFLELGLHPISRDWASLRAEAPLVAREHGATLVVMDGFQWTDVWTRGLPTPPHPADLSGGTALRSAPPPPPPIRWLAGFERPDAVALREAVNGHDRVLLAGYSEPVAPEGFVVEARFGEWTRFDEWANVVVRLPMYALLRREAPAEARDAD